MKVALGIVFSLLSAVASFKGLTDSATLLIVLASLYFILDRLDEIERKIK